MKILQFDLSYGINGQPSNEVICKGIDVVVEENWTAIEKHTKIIQEIVKSHNKDSNLVKSFGFLTYDFVSIKYMVRLD